MVLVSELKVGRTNVVFVFNTSTTWSQVCGSVSGVACDSYFAPHPSTMGHILLPMLPTEDAPRVTSKLECRDVGLTERVPRL